MMEIASSSSSLLTSESVLRSISGSTAVMSAEDLTTENLEIDDVRITPRAILFENAYDGKHFSCKLVIQNCGSKLAFVRMGYPSSNSFEVKPFPRGYKLSPGLRIVRTVNYVYRATIPITRGYAPIYINDKQVDYQFNVNLSMAVLLLEPQQLDFGRIDAVNIATTRTFYIKNTGCKGTQFAVDLGRNELELMVDPMKGTVHAKSAVAIRVEIVGCKEGDFVEEFWIKTSPPLRVVLTGTFISPKLVVRKFIAGLDFTLMEFPPTYFGANSTKPLLLKNKSSSHSMFYIMGEIKGVPVPLDEARKMDVNFANFSMMPIDGRLAAEKGSIVQMTFTPIKGMIKEKYYAACFVKCFRMDCRDIDFETVSPSRDLPDVKHTGSNLLSASRESFFNEEDILSSLEGDSYANLETSHLSFEHVIGICLYGKKVQASVNLRPTYIILRELTVNKSYDRVILITNKSWGLPITVKYVKFPSVDVDPSEVYIPARGSVEVKIMIKTPKLGDYTLQIHFDLLAPDYPKELGTIRKVGSASFNIHLNINTTCMLPRLEQCLLCYDLPMKLPPQPRYRLSPSEREQKTKNDNYYIDYIANLRRQREEALFSPKIEDYQISYQRHQALCCQDPQPKIKPVVPYTPFIPLAPRQLFYIKISPKSMKLRKVAAFTTITEHFHIQNLNPFPVRIRLTASKPCIVFPDDGRYTIHSEEKKKIPFNFSTTIIGRYNVNINVVINDSTLFEIAAVAQVVPKTLKLETSDIVFLESDGHYKFFNLINGLNATTKFDWDVPKGCFAVYPSEGRIRAECFLTTMVVYEPDPSQPIITECSLNSESGQKKIVQFAIKKRKPSIIFDTYEVDFGLVPLNIPVMRKISMRNEKLFKVLFSIPDNKPAPGIVVEPREGFLIQKDSQVFTISVCLNAVIDVAIEIIFLIDEEFEYKVAVRATVDYPKFSISPEMLHFRKIAVYSIETLSFKVKNLSQGEMWVLFPIEEFPEFSITDVEDIQLPHQDKIVLQPHEAKILFLHFHPEYISTYTFALPYIINDVVGPVHLNSSKTHKPRYFLLENEILYGHIEGVIVNDKISASLPVIRVNSSAVDKFLDFSSLTINMVYFGENHYGNKTTSPFEITNTSGSTSRICIRTDHLEEPFSLVLKSEQEIEYYEVSYLMELEPGEKIVFEAGFQPEMYGEYEIKLPIFLRHYFDNKIFNYLKLKGVYDRPEITSSVDCVDFEPVPLRIKNDVRLTLHMVNHFKDCQIKTLCDVLELKCIFESGRSVKSKKGDMKVLLSFASYTEQCFDSTLTFECSCNSSCTITVRGVADSCQLTTHAFFYTFTEEHEDEKNASRLVTNDEPEITGLSTTSIAHTHVFDTIINKNITTYPLFPSDNDTSTYACYMRRLQKTLENWLYTQVFYKKAYLRIPESFTYLNRNEDSAKKKTYGITFAEKKVKSRELPLLQLMLNVTSQKIRDTFISTHLESNKDIDVLTYTCKVYTNILRYLGNFDIYLPHVNTMFLLSYEQYCLYEKMKWSPDPLMAKEIFEAYSKQCWIDLILQIIKEFVLFRTVDIKNSESISVNDDIATFSESSGDRSEKQSILDICCDHTAKIVEWLISIYEEEKFVLWEEADEIPESKQIMFLDEDLRDGLVLGAVTSRFCPYVKHLLKSMYPKPTEPEEIFHNACTLVQTWKSLKLSIEITPFSIQDGDLVEMIILISYLYSVLPSYYPHDTITIQAPLTLTNSKKIEICNEGEDPILYTVIVFGNENDWFRIAKRVTVQPKEPGRFKVTYHAKCVGTARATVVFSGETPGQKYGKSVAVNLVGIAEVSHACMSIPVTVKLYSPCEVVLNIQSPFKVKADYSVFLGYEGQSKLYPWEEIRHLKIIRDILLSSTFCSFDENGFRSARPVMCPMETGPRKIWGYYTNPEIGDWAVELVLTGKVTQNCYENLFVTIPENYDDIACRCKNGPDVTKNCPSILYLNLPAQNNKLWEARKAMTLNGVEGEELRFWEKRIYTSTGTRILTLILNSETHDLKQIIDQPVEYDIFLGKNAPFKTLKSIVIEDVNSEDYYELPIHPSTKNLLQLDAVSMRLVSKDSREQRFYKIRFNMHTSIADIFPGEGSDTTPRKSIRLK